MIASTKETVDRFIAITNSRREEAERFLELTAGNLEAAVGLYMDAGGGPGAHVDLQNQAAQGSPNSGVAQVGEKHERRRQRQSRSGNDDDPFDLGPEAPFGRLASAPADDRQSWTAACGSGWPTGDSSPWPTTASVAQTSAVPSTAILVNGAPISSRRNVPRFDDAILDALQDLPSNTLASMLRRLAQQRPAEFSEAFGQKTSTAGAWPASGAATPAKSPWSAGATADPAAMAKHNSGLDSWPATNPGASPLPQRATPRSSPALPTASARAPGSSPPSRALTPHWDHPNAATPVEAVGSPPSASASPMVPSASLRNTPGWPVQSSPRQPLASSASPVPPSTTGAVGSWPVPNSPAMAVAAAAAAAAPSGGLGPSVPSEPAVPDPWGEAAATPEHSAAKSPWPEAAAPAPDFAWPVAGDVWPAQA